MSGEFWDTLVAWFVIPAHLLTSASGVVTNALNMVIMSRLGLSNSMNVEIFSLALSDFFVTFVELLMYSCCLLGYIYPDHSIDFWSLGFITIGWIPDPAYFVSNWIITLISLERCVSVVLPFRVKLIFTRKRSVFAILLISATFIGLVSPLYQSEYISWDEVMVAGLNGSVSAKRAILKAHFTERADIIIFLIDVVCAISLTLVSQTTLFVCTATMIYSLRISSKIRLSSEFLNDTTSALSAKERRLAKVAISLALLLTGCYFPRYINIVVYYTSPGFFADPKFDNFMWLFTSLIISLNFSSNFFVYLKLNVKFRQCFIRIFTFCK